jgi:energy-coupling factor transporter ATP-binding protein EcfA2
MRMDLYLLALQEGYILSDKTVSVDLAQFESGEQNKLLIVGTAGSGKTTLSEKLAKKYKVKWIGIDYMWWRLRQKYFKDAPKSDATERKLIKKVIEFTMESIKSNERLIIEGVDLLNIYSEVPEFRKVIIRNPMIVFGMSALRAGIRAGLRNMKRDDEDKGDWRVLYWMPRFNLKHIEPSLKMLRRDISHNSDRDIQEYKL